MTEIENLVRDMARAIAEGLGDNFDYAHDSKPHWIETRGESGGRFRDINEPRKLDYLDAAKDALLVALPIIGEMAAGVAGKVILDARMGEIDKDLRAIGHILHSEIRGRLSKLETELRKGDDHG